MDIIQASGPIGDIFFWLRWVGIVTNFFGYDNLSIYVTRIVSIKITLVNISKITNWFSTWISDCRHPCNATTV